MPISSNFVLVVGGAGYIGSHMVLALRQAGIKTVVLDNLSKGHREAVLDAELIVGDIKDKKLLEDVFRKYSFSAVMHFASYIEVGESIKFPAKYYQNNLCATINLLEVMLKHEVKQFVFSSTASVYGEPQARTIFESHPLAPINPYGRSKLMVEQVIQDLAKSDGLKYAILRYFNAAGADPEGRIGERHDPESHLIPLILQVAAGEKPFITIYGDHYPTADGTCIRDYVHVVDICNAHLLALFALNKDNESIICNIGTGQGHSVLQVIKAAHRITGKPIPYKIGLPRSGDAVALVANAGLAHDILRWRPKYSTLDTILKHAWSYYHRQC